LIEHGRTGLLTDDEGELADLVIAAGLLDRAECRQVAADRFTPETMARRYLELYEQVHRQPAAAAMLVA
jgi:glycosyltransferase involved in cell wall biosynthesis